MSRGLARWAGINNAYVSPFLTVSVIQLTVALLLGGASRENLIPATIVELVSIILLPWTTVRLANQSRSGMTWPLVVIGLIAAIVTLQLIPMPPQLWSALPGRETMVRVYKAAGMNLPVRPLSYAPDLTIRSSLYLITPITVFLGWITLSSSERRLGIIVILMVMVLGLVLGAVQVAAGGANVGYLYRNTNYGSLVGLFSNRNHEASLLLISLPLTAGLLVSGGKRTLKRNSLIAIGLALTLVVMGALAAVHSRAGVLLLIPSLLCSVLVIVRSGRFGRPRKVLLFIGLFVGAALALVTPFAFSPLLARFDTGLSLDTRFAVAPDIWALVLKNLPFGSGPGTFDIAYRSVENLNFVNTEFLNHAHNDYLEIALETGVFGVGTLIAFIAWWSIRLVQVWGKGAESGSTLARAASIGVGLLLIHSAFDYPMRTLAIGAIFAFFAALMVPTSGKP
jgi:O-antigen ligase